MNVSGEIAGDYVVYGGSTTVHGYLRNSNGDIYIIDYPGSAGDSEIVAVNNAGGVAGYYDTTYFVYHGLYRTADGGLASFDAPGAGSDSGSGQGTYPTAMNSSGAITGYYVDPADVKHGFVRDASGVIQTFDVPGAGGETYTGTQAFAINDGGAVAGVYSGLSSYGAFFRSPKGTITTFTIPNSGSITVKSMNVWGAMTGYFSDPGTTFPLHGFIRTVDGAITTFDAPSARGGVTATLAWSITDQGYVVGWHYSNANYKAHGFVRGPGGAITSFDAPGSASHSYDGTYAYLMNDAGQIAGAYSSLGPSAFLFTP